MAKRLDPCCWALAQTNSGDHQPSVYPHAIYCSNVFRVYCTHL